MAQISLHKYGFPIRTTSSRRPGSKVLMQPFPFMRLPYSIRREIYLQAGLFTGFKIHLNYEPPLDMEIDFCTQWMSCLDLGDIPQQEEIGAWSEQLSHFIDGPLPYPKMMLDRDIQTHSVKQSPVLVNSYNDFRNSTLEIPDTPALPFQLLYVSQKVSSEVKRIFWSENYFTTSRSDIGGLTILHSLSPLSIRFLTSLSIRLNFWGSTLDWEDGLRQGTAGHPSCHATCDPLGFEEKIHIPRSNKEKRLTHEWNQVCKRLAQLIKPGTLQLWLFCDVADKHAAAMVINPLLQLPRLRDCGIRLDYFPVPELLGLATSSVSQLTSHAAPSTSTFRFLELPVELQIKILEYTTLLSDRKLLWSPNAGLGLPRISEFDENRDFFATDAPCCGYCRNEEEICYCWFRHSAFSSTCTCWRYPAAFFSVSREFRSVVIPIFFSRNKFIIKEGHNLRPTKSILHQWLVKIPEQARRYVRHVTWNKETTLYRTDHWDWIQVVDFCADQLDLTKLTFIIDSSSADSDKHRRGGYNPTPTSAQRTRWEQSQDVEWEAAETVAETMAKHKGWKDVFFHLSYQGRFLYPGNRKRLETILEKTVLGRDYDALSRGKVYRDCGCHAYYEDAASQRSYKYWESVNPNEILIHPPRLGRPSVVEVLEDK